MRQAIGSSPARVIASRAVAFNPMAALGVASYAALALTLWALPLPANRLYSFSFLLSYLALAGLAVTHAGAIVALASHWAARRWYAARAAYWLSLTKGLLLIGLAATALQLVAAGMQPMLQTRALFGMQIKAQVVTLSGATPDDMDQRLSQTLAPGQYIDRVELSGIGGSVEAAQRAAAILKAHGARVAVVTGDCASACATMFEEFPHRYVAPGGRLGFHAFWGGSLLSPAADAQQREIDRLVARGVDSAYARKLFASAELTWPSPEALAAHRLVSGCWNVDRSTPASCRTAA